jgi:hypothetical protein
MNLVYYEMERILGSDRLKKETPKWIGILNRLFPEDRLAPDALQMYEGEREKYFVSTFSKQSLLHTMIQPHQG